MAPYDNAGSSAIGMLITLARNVTSAMIERCMMRTSSLRSAPVPASANKVRMLAGATYEAWTWSSPSLRPRIVTEPFGPTWYCTTSRPASSTVLPVAETLVNTGLLLCWTNRSAINPAQPWLAPSGADACQIDCWSLCENSLGGKPTSSSNCALVVGRSSGPTLATTAARPAPYSAVSAASSLAMPKRRPLA